jgi:hypothetical protein
MNGHGNPTYAPSVAPQASGRGTVLRVLLPAFLLVYAALPIAIARQSR